MRNAFQYLWMALRNLATHRKRSLLLGGAIAAVTALLVVLLGLSHGMKSTMLESATTLMTGHVNVGGFYKVTAGQSAPVVTGYPKLQEQIRAWVPELDYVVQRGRGWAKLVSETGSLQVGIGGIDVKDEPGFRKVIQVRQGKLDDLQEPGTVLIFEEQAKKLDVKVGDTLTYSAPTLRGANNTLDVRVAVIAANVGLMSSWNTFIPSESLRSLYQLRDDATGALHLHLKDMSAIPAVQERLRRKLAEAGYQVMDNNPQAFWMKFETVNREGWTGQKLDVTQWEDEISFMTWAVTALDVLSFVLIFILLVIIAVGVMNTLWIAIRERTREIGTLRAIGMQREGVLALFLSEAFLLGLLGTSLGAGLGLSLCALGNALSIALPEAMQLFLMAEELHLAVQASSVLSAIALITFCTTAIALLPSFLAARLKPVTAMHHIG